MEVSIASRFVEWGRKKNLRSFLFCLLTAGAFNYLCLIFHLWLRWYQVKAEIYEIILLGLAITWLPIGLWSIWYYEHVLLAKFRQNFVSIVDCKDADKCKLGISYKTKLIVVFIWATIVTSLYIYNSNYCFQRLGMSDYSDVIYWVSVLSVIVQSILTGVGLSLSLNTILIVIKVHDSCPIILKPYHPDKKGGFSIFQELCLKTSVLLSTGFLYVPILIVIAVNMGEYYAWGVIGLAASYSLFLILSFIVPYMYIYNKLKNKIKKELTAIGSSLYDLYNISLDKGNNSNYIFNRITIYRYLYTDIKDISLHPLSAKALLFIISQLILPLVFILVKIYLENNLS